jgi:hypothetical protein
MLDSIRGFRTDAPFGRRITKSLDSIPRESRLRPQPRQEPARGRLVRSSCICVDQSHPFCPLFYDGNFVYDGNFAVLHLVAEGKVPPSQSPLRFEAATLPPNALRSVPPVQIPSLRQQIIDIRGNTETSRARERAARERRFRRRREAGQRSRNRRIALVFDMRVRQIEPSWLSIACPRKSGSV